LGLLPDEIGWDESRITSDLDAVILGMHAKYDNPELLKACELGLAIYSFPEYLHEQSKNKKRVVIGGSHGKTTITAMILHVLKQLNMDFDYMVGAQLDDFDVMVKISETAPVMILEGDEYLTSALDKRPKFHVYKPDIALVTGIAWDHINVFPTFENYIDQFRIFIDLIPDDGVLVFYEKDPVLKKLVVESSKRFKRIPYTLPEYHIEDDRVIIAHSGKEWPVKVFGEHNMSNLLGALKVCSQLGIEDSAFMEAIGSFKGAAKRLELVDTNRYTSIYKDFAHAPSKLKATTKAVKEQFPDRELVACTELHTYSSLNRKFLPHYRGCIDDADIPVIYFNPHALKLKRLPEIGVSDVREAFGLPGIKVFNNSEKLLEFLLDIKWDNKNLLMMSSGNFDGMDFDLLAGKILKMSNEKRQMKNDK